MRDWDDETGQYDYYWLDKNGARTVKQVVLANGEKYSALCYYGHEVRAGRLEGKFVYKKVDMSGRDRWSMEVAPGQSAEVPTHRETYAQSAARTGQFRSVLQHRRAK